MEYAALLKQQSHLITSKITRVVTSRVEYAALLKRVIAIQCSLDDWSQAAWNTRPY